MKCRTRLHQLWQEARAEGLSLRDNIRTPTKLIVGISKEGCEVAARQRGDTFLTGMAESPICTERKHISGLPLMVEGL